MVSGRSLPHRTTKSIANKPYPRNPNQRVPRPCPCVLCRDRAGFLISRKRLSGRVDGWPILNFAFFAKFRVGMPEDNPGSGPFKPAFGLGGDVHKSQT